MGLQWIVKLDWGCEDDDDDEITLILNETWVVNQEPMEDVKKCEQKLWGATMGLNYLHTMAMHYKKVLFLDLIF